MNACVLLSFHKADILEVLTLCIMYETCTKTGKSFTPIKALIIKGCCYYQISLFFHITQPTQSTAGHN
jgi:hypothetical protein